MRNYIFAMHSITFSDIAIVLNATPAQQYSNPVIEYLLTDSRKLLFAEHSLFFAINSSQNNADKFIGLLYQSGVRCFITGKSFSVNDFKQYPQANFITVDDVIIALQKITAHHRNLFNYPVIGITGSNGKTIVKEWLYQLLNNDYNIVRSPKSYNSQIGVPLSVWQMNNAHTLGIFEAGISQPGEMEQLEKIIAPQIGIVTVIGDAHAESFKNPQQKINEKLKLFLHSKIVFYCADDGELDNEIKTFSQIKNKTLSLFSWGKKNAVDLCINNIDKQAANTIISCRYADTDFDFTIPFTDEASVNNAITCCCILLYLKIDINIIAEKMLHLKPVEMRLEMKQGINNCSVINDSYNADINSLNIALDFLQQQQQHSRHTLILSDVLQSGLSSAVLYKNIAAILQQKSLHRFIGIGPQISENAAAFNTLPEKYFYSSTKEFLQQLPSLQFKDETILLKGARVFTFEKISRALEQKMHQTFLEIDLNALRHNLKAYRQQLKQGVKLMGMVKAFSYGSGSFEIASLLQHAGADYLGVAYADEGVELRKAGISLPVMVMNTEEAGFDNIIKYNLEPELYSFNILNAFKNYLQQNNISGYKVHIKLDTGMHRLGFEENELEKLCTNLKDAHQFHVQSVFSHLVASDDEAHDAFTKIQSDVFFKMAAAIQSATGYTFIKHISNTSAIHRHPQLQLDMVRLGIGLYGVDTAPEMQQRLKNVTTLKTTISQIKHVKKGESVGYSRKGIVNKDAVIATVRIGYADGYPRALGNGAGKMLLNGQPAPVIGNVCMDMTMLDITGIEAEEEDEVIVFGEPLSVSTLATWAHTIPYEILTNISQRVRRVYFEE